MAWQEHTEFRIKMLEYEVENSGPNSSILNGYMQAKSSILADSGSPIVWYVGHFQSFIISIKVDFW